MKNWIKLKIEDTTQVIAPQWLAMVCGILVLLSAWIFSANTTNNYLSAFRILVVVIDFILVFYTLFPANYTPYKSYINEIIIGFNSAFLLLQVYLSNMNPEIAYFTLLSVYFIGQFTNHKSFFKYYPLLLFVVWYLIVVTNYNPRINAYVLLIIAFVFSFAIFWINQQRIALFETMLNQKTAFQESNKLFQNMFAKSPIGTALIDKNLLLLRANNSLCEMLGYDAAHLAKMKIIDISSEEMVNVDKEIYKNIFAGNNQFYKTERKLIKKNGQEIWVNMSLSAITKDNGEPVYILLIAEDIGEQKSSEHQILQYTNQIEKVKEELSALSNITTNKIQLPLRELSNYLDWLIAKKIHPENEQMVEAVGQAKHNVDHIRLLINDLVRYSQVTKRSLRIVDVDIEKTIEQVSYNLTDLINERSAIIHYEDLPIVLADELDVIQIFQQIIQNAIIHCTGKVPIIKISYMEDTDKWIFQIADNGNGISEEDKEKIFDLFYQTEDNMHLSGSGVGLTIARKTVEKMGGDIWVSSQQGVGSTFYFTIPKR